MIFTYPRSEYDLIIHLRIVLQTLKERQLFVKLRKCEFCLTLISFLGHIVSSNGIEVDSKNMNVVKIRPRPLSSSDIVIFIGLVS